MFLGSAAADLAPSCSVLARLLARGLVGDDSIRVNDLEPWNVCGRGPGRGVVVGLDIVGEATMAMN